MERERGLVPEWQASSRPIVQLPVGADFVNEDRVLLERLMNNAYLKLKNRRPMQPEETRLFVLSADGTLSVVHYSMEAVDAQGYAVVQSIFAPNTHDTFESLREVARLTLPGRLGRTLPQWQEYREEQAAPVQEQKVRSRWSLGGLLGFGKSSQPISPTGPSAAERSERRQEYEQLQLEQLASQLEPLFPQMLESIRTLAAGREKAVLVQKISLAIPRFAAKQSVELRVNGKQAWLVADAKAITGGRELVLRILVASHKVEQYFVTTGEKVRLEPIGPLSGIELDYSQPEQGTLFVTSEGESTVTFRAGDQLPTGASLTRMPPPTAEEKA